MHAGKRFPVVAAIVGAIHVTRLLVLDAPGGNINVFRILRIDGDVIENVVIATQVRQASPIVSAIVRQEQAAGAGAQVDTDRDSSGRNSDSGHRRRPDPGQSTGRPRGVVAETNVTANVINDLREIIRIAREIISNFTPSEELCACG